MRQRHPSIADGTWWRQDWWIGKQINRNNRTEDTERRKNGSYIKEHEWCETEQEYVTCEITVPREDDRRNETESLFKGMIAASFPDMVKGTSPQIPWSQWIWSKIAKKKSTPRERLQKIKVRPDRE